MSALPEGSRQYSTYWLSFHAPYRCRHSGACCSSGWDIPIEKTRVAPVARAIDDGRIVAPVRWLRSAEGAPEDVGGVLATDGNGRCVFRSDRCAIHAALGHSALPAACQHFPRVVLINPRGMFVTLSHYCPTAAALLIADEGPATIVEGARALPGDAMPEGLDARDALPPLRSPRMLMDYDGYSAWERELVYALTTTGDPGKVVTDAMGRALSRSDIDLFDVARLSVPAPYVWPAAGIACGDLATASARPVGRFLAAHAFACWMAYQGNGLRSIAMYLRLVLAVLRVEAARHDSLLDAIRQSDLLLRHLVDRDMLAARISALSA
jgi:hypothetical protein